MGHPAIETRKWTRVEYDRLAEAEILGSADRIELLGGAMIVKEPQARRRSPSTMSPSLSPISQSSPATHETIGTLIPSGRR